ncbi:MAG TPA: hypothetical protein VKB38_22920 [Terracidiphilus sp.]|nr:hypothetical protein [Terracidiphilus sp.]
MLSRSKPAAPAPQTSRRRALVLLLVAANLVPSASAQWIGKQTGCLADHIEATPNRPTVSNTAHVTQYGVLEVEYGWDRQWPSYGLRQTSTGGMLKFGMLCDIELAWVNTSFISQVDSSGTFRTPGDNAFGTQIRFHKQDHVVPSMSFAWGIKVPTASTHDGIGSGLVDTQYTFGASEDIHDFTFDFNATRTFAGKPGGGFDTNQEFALAGSHPVYRTLGISLEAWGDTKLNGDTPAFASSLGALTWTVIPRLVLDSGYEAGITSGGPHRHVFFGIVYSIANLYQHHQPK